MFPKLELLSLCVVVPGLDWPEDHNTAVHGKKNRYGAVELTEQLTKEPMVVQSQQDELEKQQEDDGKVSHSHFKVPHYVDCASHLDDKAIASQA